jgi:hypothetical protein
MHACMHTFRAPLPPPPIYQLSMRPLHNIIHTYIHTYIQGSSSTASNLSTVNETVTQHYIYIYIHTYIHTYIQGSSSTASNLSTVNETVTQHLTTADLAKIKSEVQKLQHNIKKEQVCTYVCALYITYVHVCMSMYVYVYMSTH